MSTINDPFYNIIVSPAWLKKITHTVDDDDENVVEEGFHVRVAEAMDLHVLLMDDQEETFENYNNEILLLVKKVYETGSGDPAKMNFGR